ncbi:MAG: agmatinase family protein [Rikenellaceae bacterium]
MEKKVEFDPDSVGIDNGKYFGMPFTRQQSKVVLISVPWDVTVSYAEGTSAGPQAIIKASTQLDFFDPECQNNWRSGIATLDIDESIFEKSQSLRQVAKSVIDDLTLAQSSENTKLAAQKVNLASEWLNEKVYNGAKELIKEGKIVGLVGGDHSTPYGAIKAAAEHYGDIGLVHLDAHMDLRKAYEGFTHSHASIMYNVSENCPGVSRFVQIGVRDFAQSEWDYAQKNEKFEQWSDDKINEKLLYGESFISLIDKMIEPLPKKVYISFDIDALEPSLCPSTGTPVAGGLSFAQSKMILSRICNSERVIVGFDLCEVAPSSYSELDANVGARILFKLCSLAIKSSLENDKQG